MPREYRSPKSPAPGVGGLRVVRPQRQKGGQRADPSAVEGSVFD